MKAELFEIFYNSSVLIFFSSEKNETALNRVELLWYRLSLLIKSQVHLAQRGRENLLQTRFIMAAKDGGTASVLPSYFYFVWNILQRYAGLFRRVWDSISWMGSNIHFIIQNTWPISLSAYDRNIKNENLARPKKPCAVDYPVLWICQPCLQGLISTVTHSLWGRTEFEVSFSFFIKAYFQGTRGYIFIRWVFIAWQKNLLCQ